MLMMSNKPTIQINFCKSRKASIIRKNESCVSRACPVLPVDPPVLPEFDFARMESIIKEQCDRIVADSAQRCAKIALELAELKAMQGQLVDSVSKVSHTKKNRLSLCV